MSISWNNFEHCAKYGAVHDAAQLMGITIEDGNVGSIAIASGTARADGKPNWCVSGINRYIEVTKALDTAALNAPAQEVVKPAPVLHTMRATRDTEHNNDAEADQPTLF